VLVCVTGGTGFVGSHSIAALRRADPAVRIRVLARDPGALGRVLGPLGLDPARPGDGIEAVAADATDPAAVDRSLRGCDAVLHAAAVFSFDARRAAEMRRVNAAATSVVLEACRRAGVRRTVYVSTIAALYPAADRVVDGGTEVGRARVPYLASKAAAERVARARQDAGDPLLISYPPALLGPHDPRLGDQTARLRAHLRGLTPLWPAGGFPVGDVRDTARLHAELLLEPKAAARCFGPHRYLTTRELIGTMREVTGRRLPALFLPARALLPVGAAVSVVQRVWPWHIPAEYGAIYMCGCATRIGDTADTGGVPGRPVAETVADTVRWLYKAGHVTARQAGAAAC